MRDLRSLQIENNEITDHAGYSITQANTKLEDFRCNHNPFSARCISRVIKALQNISTVTKLYIGNNNITDEVADGIADVIYKNTKLQEFDVNNNNLKSISVYKIARALQSVSTLTKLYLNNIVDGSFGIMMGVGDIALVLRYNNQLQELNISSNKFSAAGIKKITDALQTISTLKKLYVSDSNITDKVAGDIATALSCNVQLEVLDISENAVGTKGFIKIANALQQISTLQQLYISDNNITDEASDDIVNICFCNTKLETLYFNKNLFTDSEASALYAKCNDLLISLPKTVHCI